MGGVGGSTFEFIKKLYIQKVHEKWSIFGFYDMFEIVVVFEIIAFEILYKLFVVIHKLFEFFAKKSIFASIV